MRSLNLVLAFFWLSVGLVVLLWPWENPERLTVLGTGISAGWLALLLAAYNMVRWWAWRQYTAQQRALTQALRRQRAERRRQEEPPHEPDPKFDFGPSTDSGPPQLPP